MGESSKAKKKVVKKTSNGGEDSNFVFTLNAAKMLANMKVATSIVPITQNDAVFLFKCDGESLWLLARTEQATLGMQCKGVESVKGTGFFGVNMSLIQGIMKGRGSIEFTKKGSEIFYKATKGSYKGDFITLPVLDDAIEDIESQLQTTSEGGSTASVGDDLLTAIKEGLARTALTAVHTVDPLDSYIRLLKGNLEISACDNWHLAFYQKKMEDTKSVIQLSAPTAHFDTLSKLSKEYKDLSDKSKFYMDSDSIRVHNKFYKIALPTNQSSDDNFKRAKDYIKDLPSTTAKFGVKTSTLSNTLNNITSLYEDGSHLILELSSKKDTLKLATSTTYGKAEDTLKVIDKEGSAKLDLDPLMVLDILGIVDSDKLVVEILGDVGFMIRSGEDCTITYVGSSLGEK